MSKLPEYESKNQKKSGFVGLVVMWIGSSAITQVANKTSLNNHVAVLVLVGMQMLFGALYALMDSHSFSRVHGLKSRTKVYVIGIVNVIGHVLTMYSSIFVVPALTHTIRALEPIFVAVLAYFMLNRQFRSTIEVISILLMCIGAGILGISKSGDGEFNIIGIYLALLANFSLAMRNVLTKQLQMQDVSLLYPDICFYGFITISPFFVSVVLLSFDWVGVPWLYLAAFCHVLYSTCSIMVLAEVDPVTHTVIKLGSRIVIVVSTAFVFHFKPSIGQVSGCSVCFAGLIIYTLSQTNKVHQKVKLFTAVVVVLSLFSFTLLEKQIAPLSTAPHLIQESIASINNSVIPLTREHKLKQNKILDVVPIKFYYMKTAPHNLGDAILDPVFDSFLSHACTQKRQMCSRVYEAPKADVYVLGGGSLLRQRSVKSYLETWKRHPDQLLFTFGTGWDDYSQDGMAFSLAKKTAMNTSNLNWTIETKEFPDMEFMAHLNKSKTFGGFRGPLTKAIMIEGNDRFETHPIIGDSGLLANFVFESNLSRAHKSTLFNTPDVELLRELEIEQPTKCTSVVIISHGRIGLWKSTRSYVDHEKATPIFADIVQYIWSEDPTACFIGLPVTAADITFTTQIRSIVESRSNNSTLLGQYVNVKSKEIFLNFKKVMDIYRMASLAITYKLHAMILGASVNTPFLNFAYHYKNYDFGIYAGMEDYLIHGDELNDWKWKLDKIKRNKDQISSNLQSIISKAYSAYEKVFLEAVEAASELVKKKMKSDT